MKTTRGIALAASSLLFAAGCGSSGNGAPYDAAYGDAGWPGFDASARDASVADTALPPEVEERRSFQTPQAGGRYVYVANPARDNVAVIDSRTLAIETVEAGDRPTYLLTVSGQDQALVINVGSDNLSVLRTDEHGTRTSSVPIAPGANALAVSPDGRHAVVYLDTNLSNSTGTGSFQDITLVTLEAGNDRAVQLSVGFRPLEVQFSSDGSAAFVITEDGISILRFAEITGPTIIPNVTLGDSDTVVTSTGDAGTATDAMPPADGGATTDDGGEAGATDAAVDAAVDASPPRSEGVARDVSVTSDGRYAIARVEGSPWLRLVDLTTRAITFLNAGAPVTDLDIAPSGAFALAVLRDQGRVLRLPIPGAFTDASVIQRTDVTGELVGSVTISPDSHRALLYTTAAPVERLTVLDLTGAEPGYVLRLRKTVRAAAFAPDSRTALVVNGHIAGDPDDPNADLETRIDRSFGYTMVDPGLHFAKLQLTPADVGPFAIMPDGAASFVLLRDDAAHVAQVQMINMRSFAVDTINLGSPPTSVGAVPATLRAFVGQDHPEGRITFVDWTTGALQSVTGFELNARVVQ